MSVSMIYITVENGSEAERLGRMLVESRLAACVNIIDGMRSIYRWRGKVESASEAVLIAKTKTELVEHLTRLVVDEHGYECPCVVSMPIEGGNLEFIRWIEEQTG